MRVGSEFGARALVFGLRRFFSFMAQNWGWTRARRDRPPARMPGAGVCRQMAGRALTNVMIGPVPPELPSIFEPIWPDIQLLHARLSRAEEHHRAFGRIWAEYLDSNPHRLDRVSEDEGVVTVRLRHVRPIPPVLSVVSGNCSTNFALR